MSETAATPTKLTNEIVKPLAPAYSTKDRAKSTLYETNILKKQSSTESAESRVKPVTTNDFTVPKQCAGSPRKNNDVSIRAAGGGSVLHKSSSLDNDINKAGNNASYPRYGLKHLGMRTYSQQNSLDSTNSDDSACTFTSATTERRGSRNQADESCDSITNQRMNFSSKVNRGNKLRKSKRIEESHRFFQSKTDNPKSSHYKNELHSNSRRPSDFSLRYTANGGGVGGGLGSSTGSVVSHNRFSEAARDKPAFNKYVTSIKSRLGSSQGDVTSTE